MTHRSDANDSVQEHHPGLLTGQKAAIPGILLKNRGNWVPSYKLAGFALQYSSRLKELRNAGYVIENRTTRVAGKVHGAFRLVVCPEDDKKPPACEEPPLGGAIRAERFGE